MKKAHKNKISVFSTKSKTPLSKKRGWFKWAVFILAAVVLTIGGMQLLDHSVDKFDNGSMALAKHDRGGHDGAGWFWFLAIALLAGFLIWKLLKEEKASATQQHRAGLEHPSPGRSNRFPRPVGKRNSQAAPKQGGQLTWESQNAFATCGWQASTINWTRWSPRKA